MATGVARVQWYESKILAMTTIVPAEAHTLAAVEAAGAGAKMIRSKGTGTLARDVSRPKPVAPMVSYVGSELPYARIENFGGVIRPKRGGRLLIHSQRRGVTGGFTRSTFGGDVTASADQVVHRGKHYLEVVVRVFPPAYMAHLRRLMPK